MKLTRILIPCLLVLCFLFTACGNKMIGEMKNENYFDMMVPQHWIVESEENGNDSSLLRIRALDASTGESTGVSLSVYVILNRDSIPHEDYNEDKALATAQNWAALTGIDATDTEIQKTKIDGIPFYYFQLHDGNYTYYHAQSGDVQIDEQFLCYNIDISCMVEEGEVTKELTKQFDDIIDTIHFQLPDDFL